MPAIDPTSLPLLKALLLPLLLVHFAWLGMVAGGTTVAVALDLFATPPRRRLAAALLARVVPGPSMAVLPVLTATLLVLGGRFGYGAPVHSVLYPSLVLAPLLTGLGLLLLYRRGRMKESLAPAVASALGGVGLVLLSCFLLLCGSGVLVSPEKWPLLPAMPLQLLSWTAASRYLEFTCFSFAATGALLLMLGEGAQDRDLGACARRLGRGLVAVFLSVWPPTLLLGLFNLPAIALSPGIWLLAAAGLITASGAVWVTVDLPAGGEGRRRARSLLRLVLLLFALWVASDHLARESALGEATLGGLSAVAAVQPLPPQGEAKPAAAPAEPVKGEEVFARICSACHRFDARLVGPPLNSVVPKYHSDPEALRSFIRSPVKRDPAYPPMPKLALSEAEIEAVAAYLLQQVPP
jgi:mono/diheme cytochrome c family protein